MNLENYWQILARPENEGCDWRFYPNGCFAKKDGEKSVIYTPKGHCLLSENIDEVVCIQNTLMAFKENSTWIILNSDGEYITGMQYKNKLRVLSNGLVVSESQNGETFISPYADVNNKVSIGYKVLNIVCAPNGLFAYEQQIRNIRCWCVAKFDNGQITKGRLLCNVRKISFFDNGNYAVFLKNKMVHIFNYREQKIFACNYEHTYFRKVGENYFLAFNGMKYKGVYSAETCKLIFAGGNVEYLYPNGAYYFGLQGLVLPYFGDEFGSQIYDFTPFGTLAAFGYKGYVYVVDTNMSIADLYQEVLKVLQTLSSEDTYYKKYLINLLALLC